MNHPHNDELLVYNTDVYYSNITFVYLLDVFLTTSIDKKDKPKATKFGSSRGH